MFNSLFLVASNSIFFFQAEDGIRDKATLLEFRRVLFRSRVRGNSHARFLARIFHKYRTRMGGTGHRPVPSGDSPDGTGTTPCGNEGRPTGGAPVSFRPASGRAARAGRPCHPDKCEISGLGGCGRVNRPYLPGAAFARLAHIGVMVTVGYILCIIGIIAANVGTALFLAVAYRRGLGWLLGCVLPPLLLVVWPLLLVAEIGRAVV